MKRWIWYGALVLSLIFYRVTLKIFTPFLLALFLSAILNPAVQWLERKTPLGRTASTVVVFVLGGLLGSGLLVLATASMLQGVATFLELLPTYRTTFLHWSTDVLGKIGALYLRIPADVIDAVRQYMEQLLLAGQRVLTALGQSLVSALGALPGLAAILFISLLAAFFLTKDWNMVMSSLRNLLPDEWQHTIDRAGIEVGNSLGRYVVAQTIVIGISTTASILGLLIMGVNRWFTIGLIGGLLDLVPVLGPGLLYVPWAIYAWAMGHKALAIGLLVLYGGVSALRQFVEPKVVGETLGIHPLVMMAGLYSGGILFGAKGIFLAPLILIVAKAWFKVHHELAASRE